MIFPMSFLDMHLLVFALSSMLFDLDGKANYLFALDALLILVLSKQVLVLYLFHDNVVYAVYLYINP